MDQLTKSFIRGHLSYRFAVDSDGAEALPVEVRCAPTVCRRAAVPQTAVKRPVRALSEPMMLPARSGLGFAAPRP